jgi:hypothetical protein
MRGGVVMLLPLVLAACVTAPPLPAQDARLAAMQTESAVIRERIRFLRAEAMGSAFAMMQVGRRCPDRALAAQAAALQDRAGAYCRAALAYAPDQARSFEANARSTTVQLPSFPAAHRRRACAPPSRANSPRPTG